MDDREKSPSELLHELTLLRAQVKELRAALDERHSTPLEFEPDSQLVRDILNYSPVPMTIISGDEQVLFLNSSFTALLGYDREDMPDLEHWWLKAYPDPEYREQMHQNWKAASLAPFQQPDFNQPGRPAVVACRDGSRRTVEIYGANLGRHNLIVLVDVTDKLREKADREQYLGQLEEALQSVRQLSGLLPICSNCKKIRDDNGYWQQVEGYISEHSEAQFSHGICPDCTRKLYPEFYRE